MQADLPGVIRSVTGTQIRKVSLKLSAAAQYAEKAPWSVVTTILVLLTNPLHLIAIIHPHASDLSTHLPLSKIRRSLSGSILPCLGLTI